MITEDILLKILNKLNVCIVGEARLLANQQCSPTGDVDSDDDEIKELKQRIVGLREIRERLETLMTGASLK